MFVDADACVSYVPAIVAKTESLSNPIPRSFLVKSLSDFAAGLQEFLLWGGGGNYAVLVPATRAALPLLQVYVVGPALHIL